MIHHEAPYIRQLEVAVGRAEALLEISKRRLAELEVERDEARDVARLLQLDRDVLLKMLGKRIVIEGLDTAFLDEFITLQFSMTVASDAIHQRESLATKEAILTKLLQEAVRRVISGETRDPITRRPAPLTPTYCQVCSKRLDPAWLVTATASLPQAQGSAHCETHRGA